MLHTHLSKIQTPPWRRFHGNSIKSRVSNPPMMGTFVALRWIALTLVLDQHMQYLRGRVTINIDGKKTSGQHVSSLDSKTITDGGTCTKADSLFYDPHGWGGFLSVEMESPVTRLQIPPSKTRIWSNEKVRKEKWKEVLETSQSFKFGMSENISNSLLTVRGSLVKSMHI